MHKMYKRKSSMRAPIHCTVLFIAVAGVAAANPALPMNGIFDVQTLGALGDSTTMDTAAVQAAIEACAQAGGGAAFVPPGKYLIGTIMLKSGVTIRSRASA